MPQYRFYISNQQKRLKYPRSFDVADVDAARSVALRIIRVFVEVVPFWSDLSPTEQDDFVVEAVDEEDQTVLTVPFRDMDEPRA
jgi:hypothetical protein